MYLKTSIFFILCGLVKALTDNESQCVCTTVECPVEGKNIIAMGDGYADMTYYYENHNGYNVVVSAKGELTPGSLDTGTDTTTCTRKYSRMLEDDGEQVCDAGHILARRLGGYGNQPLNIFPQNSTINEGIFAQFEGKIYDCMQKANNGVLEWEFIYQSDERTMPDKVKYSASFDTGCEPLSDIFDNK